MQTSTSSFRRTGGFSLIELMIVIAIISILVGGAMPALTSFVANSKLQTARDQWFSALLAARSEAVILQRRVAVCSTKDGRSCWRQTQYAERYMVFVDRNQNWQVDLDERVLLQGEAKQVSITSNRSGFMFLPNGGSAGTNQSIKFCLPEMIKGWAVVVNNAGRARMQAVPCSIND